MTLKTRNLAPLQTLTGKTVARVIWHDSHGDVLELVFTDGTRLHVATFAGTTTKYTDADRHDVYVSLNEEEL